MVWIVKIDPVSNISFTRERWNTESVYVVSGRRINEIILAETPKISTKKDAFRAFCSMNSLKLNIMRINAIIFK